MPPIFHLCHKIFRWTDRQMDKGKSKCHPPPLSVGGRKSSNQWKSLAWKRKSNNVKRKYCALEMFKYSGKKIKIKYRWIEETLSVKPISREKCISRKHWMASFYVTKWYLVRWRYRSYSIHCIFLFLKTPLIFNFHIITPFLLLYMHNFCVQHLYCYTKTKLFNK